MYQAVLVESKLKEFFPMMTTEVIKIKTKGDMIRRGGISTIGRGIFTREIEDALLAQKIDLAVHSAKDLETELPAGLMIGAILEREDPRDCLVTIDKRKFSELTRQAKIGTSSLRRRAQLKRIRPDLNIVDLRGNVDTRIRKLQAGEFEGMVLALAGLSRLGLTTMMSEAFDASQFLPQAAQGSIAVEVRLDDQEMKKVVKTLNHETSFIQTEAERNFLKTLHGGCQIPIGVTSRIDGDTIYLEGAVFSLDGSKEVRDQLSGSLQNANEIGTRLARKLLDSGGREILDEIRKELSK